MRAVRTAAPMTGPSLGTPPRRPGSARRTSSLDLLRPWGPTGDLVVNGRARDLRTGLDGSTAVGPTALLTATVRAGDSVITALVSHPDRDRTAELVGRPVGTGFRTAVWRSLRDHYDDGSPLHLLLDELPVGMIIAGFTYRRSMPAGMAHRGRRLDVCAGWATGGSAARALTALNAPPTPDTPLAPPLADPADPAGWHTLPTLPVWGLSRRRRVDVTPLDGAYEIDAMFRDSFVDADGVEKVLHEYGVRGLVDTDDDRLLALEAEPRVLPHSECPLAAESARRMLRVNVGRMREAVSMELFGPSSCTHLNDLLRSLADAPALAAQTAAWPAMRTPA